jgi:hypothetical protein
MGKATVEKLVQWCEEVAAELGGTWQARRRSQTVDLVETDTGAVIGVDYRRAGGRVTFRADIRDLDIDVAVWGHPPMVETTVAAGRSDRLVAGQIRRHKLPEQARRMREFLMQKQEEHREYQARVDRCGDAVIAAAGAGNCVDYRRKPGARNRITVTLGDTVWLDMKLMDGRVVLGDGGRMSEQDIVEVLTLLRKRHES